MAWWQRPASESPRRLPPAWRRKRAGGLGAITALFILLAPFVIRLFGLEGDLEEFAVGLSRRRTE